MRAHNDDLGLAVEELLDLPGRAIPAPHHHHPPAGDVEEEGKVSGHQDLTLPPFPLMSPFTSSMNGALSLSRRARRGQRSPSRRRRMNSPSFPTRESTTLSSAWLQNGHFTASLPR